VNRLGFLCVFVDPTAADFTAIGKALGPLVDRHGVKTILFPQGRISDATVREKLGSLGWPVPPYSTSSPSLRAR
jgi:uroporphyrinogen-III synthase